jgi:hypothetical protein
MIDVCSWGPGANSGGPLLGLRETQVSAAHHHVHMGECERFSRTVFAITRSTRGRQG